MYFSQNLVNNGIKLIKNLKWVWRMLFSIKVIFNKKVILYLIIYIILLFEDNKKVIIIIIIITTWHHITCIIEEGILSIIIINLTNEDINYIKFCLYFFHNFLN